MPTKKTPVLNLDKENTLTMEFSLDTEQVQAIRKCIEGGSLKVVVHDVDLSHARGRGGWLYD